MKTQLLITDMQRSVLPGPHTYSPYGFMKATSETALGFCGQHRHSLTGNYPLGNGRRFFNPTLMRFMSYDSLSPFSKGGINGYAYCGGDPVNRHDPSGAFWGAVIRSFGVLSSATTLMGAVVRTMRNVVGRRANFQNLFRTGAAPSVHVELPVLSRTSNMQFAVTGASGFAGQVVSAAYGITPGTQNAVDFLAITNTITNIGGGMTGNFTAAREVASFLWAHPRQLPGVVWDTVMDLTMLDEMFITLGNGLTYAGHGINYAGRSLREVATRIRRVQPSRPHDVSV